MDKVNPHLSKEYRDRLDNLTKDLEGQEIPRCASGLSQILNKKQTIEYIENAVTGYPNNNPKAAIGAKKIPLDLVPPALLLGAAEAFKDGAAKYGAYNFRDSKIAATVYYAAMLRHLFAWFDGEDNAEDSGVHHIKHVAACCALILDTMVVGTFDDDRPTKGPSGKIIKEFTDVTTTSDS